MNELSVPSPDSHFDPEGFVDSEAFLGSISSPAGAGNTEWFDDADWLTTILRSMSPAPGSNDTLETSNRILEFDESKPNSVLGHCETPSNFQYTRNGQQILQFSGQPSATRLEREPSSLVISRLPVVLELVTVKSGRKGKRPAPSEGFMTFSQPGRGSKRRKMTPLERQSRREVLKAKACLRCSLRKQKCSFAPERPYEACAHCDKQIRGITSICVRFDIDNITTNIDFKKCLKGKAIEKLRDLVVPLLLQLRYEKSVYCEDGQQCVGDIHHPPQEMVLIRRKEDPLLSLLLSNGTLLNPEFISKLLSSAITGANSMISKLRSRRIPPEDVVELSLRLAAAWFALDTLCLIAGDTPREDSTEEFADDSIEDIIYPEAFKLNATKVFIENAVAKFTKNSAISSGEDPTQDSSDGLRRLWNEHIEPDRVSLKNHIEAGIRVCVQQKPISQEASPFQKLCWETRYRVQRYHSFVGEQLKSLFSRSAHLQERHTCFWVHYEYLMGCLNRIDSRANRMEDHKTSSDYLVAIIILFRVGYLKWFKGFSAKYTHSTQSPGLAKLWEGYAYKGKEHMILIQGRIHAQ